MVGFRGCRGCRSAGIERAPKPDRSARDGFAWQAGAGRAARNGAGRSGAAYRSDRSLVDCRRPLKLEEERLQHAEIVPPPRCAVEIISIRQLNQPAETGRSTASTEEQKREMKGEKRGGGGGGGVWCGGGGGLRKGADAKERKLVTNCGLGLTKLFESIDR